MSYFRLGEEFPSWDELPVAPQEPTSEEVAELRQIALKLIQRQLAHPELTKLSHDDLVELLHDEKWLNNPTFLQDAMEAETYFELKDELAGQGFEIFNPAVEGCYCSYEVMHERARLMADYICTHPEALPEGVSQDKVRRATKCYLYDYLATAWCYVHQLALEGVELYSLERKDPRAAVVYELLSNLTKPEDI